MENREYGNIKISEDVIATIASLAASEIDGVASMSGGITGNITEILGKKNLSKGVKVVVNEDEVFIDLFVLIEYGFVIPDVAWKIQENIKNTVETMAGLKVSEVNVHIQGVNFKKEKTEENNQ
ncbi:Asp23/Gls24 family envelope stress response protein [Alkalithermobacter paradoxus]|uniref:Alkaline shock protein 23 n=1 Tax=Alkalithermobacter paradoxus TaxID=29349 RepID=A0A1V4IAN0_9FIRM|nr:alkaline shock protein 23 [[Clostridium] thermoalcaliphilum]